MSNVPSGPQPPAGEVGVGQLYVRATDRTVWFGVPLSIDPGGSVQVGDLDGLQNDDSDNLATAKAYTDTVAQGLAPLHHTHEIADVNGLQEALDNNLNALPKGCIVLWSGLLSNIPGGWLVCNGQNGTPNLSDKFVMGAGGTNVALSTGGNTTVTPTSSNAGGHTPTGTIAGTAITVAQMPSHSHTGYTDAQGQHSHNVLGQNLRNSYAGPGATLDVMGFDQVGNITVTDAQGNHQHNIQTYGAGSDQTHTHTLNMAAVGGHTHTVTVNVTPPYIVLGYIMKV